MLLEPYIAQDTWPKKVDVIEAEKPCIKPLVLNQFLL